MKKWIAGWLVMVLWGCTVVTAGAARSSYTYYPYGSEADVTTQTTYGVNLMGGSTDVDEAMRWMAEKANGGDFVVLRTSGSDGYNQYLYDLAADNQSSLDSVETILLKNRNASYDSFVLNKVKNAEAVFFAGGDQFLYVDYIEGTPLEDALNSRIQKGIPIGGTSAGLAIQGEFVYDAANGTVYSDEALADPYNRYMTFSRNFLKNRYLDHTITDSHFEQRDRMGRLVGFLSRNLMDGWTTEAKGIAVNEQTALLIEADGSARVAVQPGGTNQSVYLAKASSQPSQVSPLSTSDIDVIKLNNGDTIDMTNWTNHTGFSYVLDAVNGVLNSSTGSVYGN
ncbi:cyanophycinase [Rossellomorea vietnamensis]|uniref:cyanophycinase n=1 Tax=Rossellomorea vietnamensis TaxID=218284 RepID=UPI001CCFDC98|nr:cyanophycinase [Rossellomorea vietnamensis]MCA0149793.1 cyanophycinase [Rossellomorea vietnamensis]